MPCPLEPAAITYPMMTAAAAAAATTIVRLRALEHRIVRGRGVVRAMRVNAVFLVVGPEH